MNAPPRRPARVLAAAIVLAATWLHPAEAAAHGILAVGDFYTGMLHPLLHFETLLSILALALWSGQLGDARAWYLPVAFSAAALLGAVAGILDVEPRVGRSLLLLPMLVLGLLVATRGRLPAWLATAMVLLFGLSQGQANTYDPERDIERPLLFLAGFSSSIGLIFFHVVTLVFRYRAFWVQTAVRILGSGIAAASLICALQAGAHTRSVSYSSWILDPQGATVTLNLTQLELTRLPWGPAWGAELAPGLATYLTDRLQLLSGGEPCTTSDGPRVLTSPRARVIIKWRVTCASSGPREILSRLLLEVAPSHLHFARVGAAGEAVVERVLTSTGPSWPLATENEDDADAPTTGSSLRSYVMIGIGHIGTGPDHLAFVLALILIAARFAEVATVITGFTVAHSITLAVAALGLATPEAQEIGALVGLSIVLVAAENTFLLSGRPRSIPWLLALGLGAMALLSVLGVGEMGAFTFAGMSLFTLCYFGLLGLTERPARLRVVIAFAFGLVHGFGFAGVLVDISLPTGRLVPALLGFNLGVEVGQLVLVAALWPVLRDLARVRHGRPHRIAVEIGSAVLCTVGMFWFLTRAFA